jgi:hypothetical protein
MGDGGERLHEWQLRPDDEVDARAGLLDELRIHLVPVLLGEGTWPFAGERAELIPVGSPSRGP